MEEKLSIYCITNLESSFLETLEYNLVGVGKKNFPNNSKIIFVKNFSSGFNNALISGFKKANGKAVLVFMADDHINHNIINLCFEKFIEGNQIVCPSRFIKGGEMIGNPFLKGLLTNLVSFFYFDLLLFQ